jgi:hypothetical protein
MQFHELHLKAQTCLHSSSPPSTLNTDTAPRNYSIRTAQFNLFPAQQLVCCLRLVCEYRGLVTCIAEIHLSHLEATVINTALLVQCTLCHVPWKTQDLSKTKIQVTLKLKRNSTNQADNKYLICTDLGRMSLRWDFPSRAWDRKTSNALIFDVLKTVKTGLLSSTLWHCVVPKTVTDVSGGPVLQLLGYLDNGCNKFLRNTGTYLQNYTTSHCTKS